MATKSSEETEAIFEAFQQGEAKDTEEAHGKEEAAQAEPNSGSPAEKKKKRSKKKADRKDSTDERADEEGEEGPSEAKAEKKVPAHEAEKGDGADKKDDQDGQEDSTEAKAGEKVKATPRQAEQGDRTEAEVQGHKTRPILMGKEAKKAVLADPKGGYAVFAITGAALLLVGLVRLGLLWFPLRWGVAAWEFGTVSQSTETMPIIFVGLSLLTYGIVHLPAAPASWVRGISAAFASLVPLLVLAGVRFLMAMPFVMAEAPDQAVNALRRTIFQTTMEIVLYGTAAALIARLLWRGVRRKAVE